jgi:hypothetical protein
MSYLDILNVQNNINSTNDKILSALVSLKTNFNSYNQVLNNNNNVNSSKYKSSYQTDIAAIQSGIINLSNIEKTIINSTLETDINNLNDDINKLNNNLTVKKYNGRAEILKENFKDLYNKQYLRNVEVLVGIIVIGGFITKMIINQQ